MKRPSTLHDNTLNIVKWPFLTSSVYFYTSCLHLSVRTKNRDTHIKLKRSLPLFLRPPISIQHCVSRIPETMTTAGYGSRLGSWAPSAVNTADGQRRVDPQTGSSCELGRVGCRPAAFSASSLVTNKLPVHCALTHVNSSSVRVLRNECVPVNTASHTVEKQESHTAELQTPPLLFMPHSSSRVKVLLQKAPLLHQR